MSKSPMPTELVKAARNLRAKLKRSFPGTIFRVVPHTTYGRGMIGSLNVYWSLGPTAEAVNKVIDKEKHKAMGIYTPAARAYGIDHTTHEAFIHKATADLCALMHVEYKGWNTTIPEHGRAELVARHILHTKDLNQGYAGIRWNLGDAEDIAERIEIIQGV